MTAAAPEIRAIRAIAVDVPMRHVLGTSQATVRSAPLMLVDLETEEGITGHAYLFCYVPAAARGIAAILEEIERLVRGEAVAPVEQWARLSRRFTLIGVQGIVRMAMAAFDVAAWDVLARAAGVPLATLLGAAPRAIRAYNSNGLGLMGADALRRETDELLEGGFGAVKLRLGYPSLAQDLAAVRAVRERLPAGVELMVDYNQALDVDEALARGHALDGEGLAWIEEPIRHDDYRGCARVAQAIATPVQIGENFSQAHAMLEALDSGACDLVMPDLERIGGVTGWQRAAALAQARAMPMSSHLFPEVSAQLLAATPTAHWLEHVDWAAPLLESPLAIVDGFARPSSAPGNGLDWDRGAIERHRIR
ncbi:MAG TPA: enolase C-terminal domain-like protein [Usitatibacter sp.]|jgi:mandelate racemase|nr:enolase C-terminal domain-like protein [Usitatibacter sp.]